MAQQMAKSRYVRAQGYNESSVGIILPREMVDNLGIKKQDTVRVTQNGNTIIVRKAVEE